MQDDVAAAGGDCLFFLADLHALTVAIDPKELAANTIEMAAALLAAGIDPEKAILFNQARVAAHAELCWILQGTARVRSEEHTSELQSLMRISYAVFCLKKKITQHTKTAKQN